MSVNKCPKCGGTDGFYTKGTVMQYYDCNGNPNGYDFTGEGRMATCLNCGKSIKLVKLLREKYRVGDTVFAIVKNTSNFQLEVVEATVARYDDTTIRLERKENSMCYRSWLFLTSMIGKQIFLDKAEAEKELAEILSPKM